MKTPSRLTPNDAQAATTGSQSARSQTTGKHAPGNRRSRSFAAQAAGVALHSATVLALVGMIALPGVGLTACSPPPPPPAPPPPPPPPPPDATPIQIDPLLQSVKPDQRVQFPQVAAPVDESLARAVIKLAEALAKGDTAAVGPMLDPSARGILERLSGTGQWQDATARIQAVRVVNIINLGDPKSAKMSIGNVYLAIQEPNRAYILAWLANRVGDNWIFSGNLSTASTRARASEFDGLSEAVLSTDLKIDPLAIPSTANLPQAPALPGTTPAAAPPAAETPGGTPPPAPSPGAPSPASPMPAPS